MLVSNLILAAAFQIGPFYEQKPDAAAVRPFWSTEAETTDVLWPLFTAHRDWWRFCFFTHYQSNDKGYQFDLLPIFWCGAQGEKNYWGVFPLYGNHPHVLFLHDIDFALWPIWMRYTMPRPSEKRMMTTHAVLWPFIHWRDDGSWGVWPFYTSNRQRVANHQTVLWPIVTWATYEADRDTAGEGSSWMFWPLAGGVTREREDQWLFLPPFFSYARLKHGSQLRAPWPIVDYESTARRERLSIWPFYERSHLKGYGSSSGSSVTRFGWKLVELYDDETRVFPFWVSRKDDSYFRLWPFWESTRDPGGVTYGRFLSLFPIRHVPAVDRNWSKFWTFYENARSADHTDHSLLWGIIRWRTEK